MNKVTYNRKLFILIQRVRILECDIMKKGILILILVLITICATSISVSAATDPLALIAGYHTVLYTTAIDNLNTTNNMINIYPPTLNIGWETSNYLTIFQQTSGAYLIKNFNSNGAGIELSGKVKQVDGGYLTSSGNFIIRLS